MRILNIITRRLLRRKRHRTKRDRSGYSARQRAFELFGEGQRPAQVCKTIPISIRTAYRYFEDFKKEHNQVPYSMLRKFMREKPEFTEKVISLLADNLDITREEVIICLQKPWGLHQAMKGEWPNYRVERQQKEIEKRLMGALAILKFAEEYGGKDPDMVRETLERLMGLEK